MSLLPVVAMVAVAGSAVGRAQEISPQARISGPWMLDAANSSPAWGEGPDAKSSRADASRGGNDPNQPMLQGAKALVQLMIDIAEMPRRLTLTAAEDTFSTIDDYGVMKRFSTTNKPEKIDYRGSKASFRTRWEEGRLIQDITGDAIELTRTFQTSPDGKHLTVTLTIRKQPDPSMAAAMGNNDTTRTYQYNRP